MRNANFSWNIWIIWNIMWHYINVFADISEWWADECCIFSICITACLCREFIIVRGDSYIYLQDSTKHEIVYDVSNGAVKNNKTSKIKDVMPFFLTQTVKHVATFCRLKNEEDPMWKNGFVFLHRFCVRDLSGIFACCFFTCLLV